MSKLGKSNRYIDGYRIQKHAPGLMKYNFNITDLLTDTNIRSDNKIEWQDIPFERYVDIHDRLVPNTTKGKQLKFYKILMAIESEDKNCIKACLVYQDQACLITTHLYNNNYNFREINSHVNEWKICQCCMMAPLYFWIKLNDEINKYLYMTKPFGI